MNHPVDTDPILCPGWDVAVVSHDGPESGESHCNLFAGHPGKCRDADGWSFTPLNQGELMTYPDPHQPGNRQQQMSQAFEADRPMMSGPPPFPERTGQAVAPQYQSTTDKAFGPKADLDPADKAKLRDPNPASVGGRPSPIMRWFSYDHLPNDRVRGVSRQFSELAWWVEQYLPSGPEKSTALRNLLNAKDAAVRCAIEAEETGQ